MGNKNTTGRLVLLGTILAIGAVPGLARAQNAQEEVDKQVAKLIGDAISSRVAASSAGDAGEKNSVWGSYTRLKVDLPGSVVSPAVTIPGVGTVPATTTPAFNSKTDVGILGYDRDINKEWLAGVSLSFSDSGGGSDSWSLSPYVAYRFSPKFFAIGSLTYGQSNFNSSFNNGFTTSTSSADSDAYGASFSLNGLHSSNNWLAKGRAEISWNRAETDTTNATPAFTNPGFPPLVPPFVIPASSTTSSSTNSSTRGSLDGELGYVFAQGWYGYGGLQASVADSSNSYQLFARLGLEYRFAKTVSFGVKYEQKVDDNANFDIDIYSFTAVLRVAF